MLNLSDKKLFILIILPVVSILFGFFLNEDLSTGGSKLDFDRTTPIIIDFANFGYEKLNLLTRHAPLHYILMSIPYFFLNNLFIVKILYLAFSFLLPFLLYLNLKKIYNVSKINLLLVSATLLLFPYFRSSALWPNAHLTALIFLLIANYFYILSSSKKKFFYIFLNILFLSCATYSMQSYIVFFSFYLFNYFKLYGKYDLIKILLLCFIFSIPGIFLIFNTEIISKLEFTANIYYTIVTNLSISFFFICFFILNSKNLKTIKDSFQKTNKIELIFLIIVFSFIVSNFKYDLLIGGGFFYKLSHLILNNNIIFYISSFLGLLTIYLIFKKNDKILVPIILVNLTSINYSISQKYFEPLLLVLIFILFKSFLTENLLSKIKYVLFYYFAVFAYFIIAVINNYYDFSRNLIF